MKDYLLKNVKDFLQRYLISGKPLLLGYSGGPDSKALLYLLLACRSFLNFNLHLAHVDHGWRAPSQKEAQQLEEEAQKLGLTFHLLTLKHRAFKKGNLEEQARKFRLQFFSELYKKYDCQALLLGHQADDQAEIVLKRVCEGAHFSRLGGLSEKCILEKMQIWRPLLSLKKKELIMWLEQRGISYFIDPTNESSLFLRGRMRTTLLPLLSEGFGKGIIDNFCHLGRVAESLRVYFLKKISCYLEKSVQKEGKSSLEIPRNLEEIELQFLFKEWFIIENISVSREILYTITRKAKSGSISRFAVRGGSVHVDLKCIYILKDKK